MFKKLLPTIIFVGLFQVCFSQGCSDAGFCTMGAMRPDQAYNKSINFKLRALELNQYKGETTLSPVINVTTLDFTFGINDNTSVQVKVPYMSVKGNLGKTSGISDLSYSLTTKVIDSDNYDVNITVGGKIPTNNSDLKEEQNNVDFPMYYQTSLGTWDVIAGASILNSKWLFAFGVQVALNQNSNDFRYEEWDFYPGGMEYIQSHDLANNLQRGTDIMLRVERNFRFSKFNFNIGVLPIIRITPDEILNTSDRDGSVAIGERYNPGGTTGAAVSLVAGGGYSFNVNSALRLTYGYKLAQRDNNPDGLTRNTVLALAYLIRF